MSAKPVKTRIGKPRDKVKRGGRSAKTRNFTEFPLAKASYSLSVHDPRDLPRPGAPEIAFAGRSNAGKSSAINALAGRRRLAFVSKTPGRTQLINFFSLGGGAFLVDLPGYGYAGVPGEVRQHWKELVGRYVSERESLAAVVVVMDLRHPLTELDVTLIEWLREAGRRAHVLLTKSDKLSKQAAQATLARVRRDLEAIYPGATAQLFSSLKREGIAEAASVLSSLAAGKNKAPAKGE
ncbi:MAG TPA: ribosome biogenesis GTP-binding protein YihA/YsxC [Usitatibacter sp.]|nr:ribosome biogenesis GTP-binding protein YihA/YsxC [Usitatibacter sp.]